MLATSMPTDRSLAIVACQALSFRSRHLVDRAVEIEHEMNAQTAFVLEDLEAVPAGAAASKWITNWSTTRLKQREVVPAAHSFPLLFDNPLSSCRSGCSRRRLFSFSVAVSLQSSGANRGSTR